MSPAESIKYNAAGVDLEGKLLRAKTDKGKHALILYCPNYIGPKSFDVKRCEAWREIIDANFFIVDVYGEAAFPVADREDPTKFGDKPMTTMNANLMDPIKHRLKLRAGYEVAKKATGATHVASLGFCYGGLCALEMLRDGLDLKAVISFHSTLDGLPVSGGGPAIKRITEAPNKHFPGSHVLIATGMDDPICPPAAVRGVEEELKASTVASYEIMTFGRCKHGFTDPAAWGHSFLGGFQPIAARQSWNASFDVLRTSLDLPQIPLDPQVWMKVNDP